MQQEEFEHRTGLKVTDAEYNTIEEIYNNAGDLDKDEFCRDYTNGNGHNIMGALSGKCEDLRAHISKLDKTIESMEEERFDTMATLISAHKETGLEMLRDQAIALAGGKRKYIIAKCKLAIPLDDREQAWIIDLLEEE